MAEKKAASDRGIIVPPETLYKAQDLADAWGIHITTVYRLINEGKIPSILVGVSSRRIRASDLDAYIAEKAAAEEARLQAGRDRHAKIDETGPVYIEETHSTEAYVAEDGETTDIIETETGERIC